MPDSEVIRVMRQFKADLLAGEQKQSQEMARTWLKAERRLSSEMTALAYEMDGIKRDGGTVSREMLMTNVRYRELLNQLTDELEGYTDYAERTITDRQRQLARLGIRHGEQAVQAQLVKGSFNRLPVEAVQNLVGLVGDGTPLRGILTASWPLSAQRLTDELVSGVALGYNPRKVAKNMAQAAGASQQRMEVIARTEQLRVYREANRQSYKASGVVDGYRRLATHDRRVCAACLMDEGTFYELDEEMPEHPQGRCTMIPVVSGVPQPQWQQGQAWLEEQSPEVQQEILGKGRYYAWQNGDVELKDLVMVKPNATWGPSLQVTPLGELVGPKPLPPISLQQAPVSSAFVTGTQDLAPFNVVREQTADHVELTKRAQVWADALSDEQKESVNKWTRHWQITRQNIANGNIGPEERMLLDAVESAPKMEGVVYRGINPGGVFKSAQDVRDEYMRGIGTTVEWDTLSSTSILPDLAAEFGNTVFEIKTKNARYINPLSQFFGKAEDEYEAVILPNTKFRIVGVGRAPIEFLAAQQERWIVQLEEITP